MMGRTDIRCRLVAFACGALCCVAAQALAALPSENAIQAGVRIRFRLPKTNEAAAQMGYCDRDFITKINGYPVQALYEIQNLSFSQIARKNTRLTVVTTAGLESKRSVPPAWLGMRMELENVSCRKYVETYGADHGDAWDDLVMKGLAEYDQDRTDKAKPLLEKAIAAGAHDGLTYCALGRAYQIHTGKKGDEENWDLSKKYLEKAVECYKGAPSQDGVTAALAHLYLAYCLKSDAEESQNLAQLEEAYARDGKNPEIVNQVVRAYMDVSKKENALNVLKEYLALYPDHPAFINLKIQVLRGLYMLDEVLSELKKRARQNPKDMFARQQYLDELRNRRDYSGCMDEISDMLTQLRDGLPKKTETDLKSEYCSTALQAGKAKKAALYAEQLAKERGGTMDYVTLGRIYTQMGEWSKAAATFKTLDEKVAGDKKYQANQRLQIAVSKDIDEVVVHLDKSQLMQYGYEDRAAKIKTLRAQQRSFYVLMNQYGPMIGKVVLWCGVAVVGLLGLVWLFRRRSY